MVREGRQMTTQNLSKFESPRKYATLVALAIKETATVIDQIIDLHPHQTLVDAGICTSATTPMRPRLPS